MMKTFILSIGMLVLASVAFAQNCLRIVQPTLFSGPAANSTYTLTINFQTNGNKSLQTTIFCGSTVITSPQWKGIQLFMQHPIELQSIDGSLKPRLNLSFASSFLALLLIADC